MLYKPKSNKGNILHLISLDLFPVQDGLGTKSWLIENFPEIWIDMSHPHCGDKAHVPAILMLRIHRNCPTFYIQYPNATIIDHLKPIKDIYIYIYIFNMF